MIFTRTGIEGALLVDPTPAEDERGCFARTWCAAEFAVQGIDARWEQCNFSVTKRQGTIRGLHFQSAPHAEAKLVRVVRGSVYDVAVDLRPESPTFGRWAAFELSAETRRAVYIPEGCAHGFQTLVDDVEMLYQMSAAYAAGSSRGIRWDDPALGIEWPLPLSAISPRDAAWPAFAAAAPLATAG